MSSRPSLGDNSFLTGRSRRSLSNQYILGAAINAPSVLDLIHRPSLESGNSAGRICIVTGEIAGPDYNGGIGTANRGLALALQNAGFSVDVLYTRVEAGQPFCYRGSFEEQVAAFRSLGINLVCINHQGNWDDWLAKSLRVMETLQSRPYDVAFFDDTHGNAYYTALAKRSGSPALAHMQIVVVTHSATQWIFELNHTPVKAIAGVRMLEIERRSIELADFVVAPSAYILKKYQSYGWTLPTNTLVRPNILPFSTERGVPPRRQASVDEIVFFGRIERRKGVWLFCEALDRLKYQLAGKKITFLGKFTGEDGESTGFTLIRRSAEWPFAPTLLYNYDRDQALSYLKGGNRLAVMPSREDNSPCVILECLIEGIPFIASSGSGGQELVSEVDRATCLFEPTADSLTAKLSDVLKQGITTAQPSFSPRDNARQTIDWITRLVSNARAGQAASDRQTEITRQAPLRRTLLFFAPDEMSPELIRDRAIEVAHRHSDALIKVFAEASMSEVDAVPDSPKPPDNLSIFPLRNFFGETAKLKKADGMLLLCRLDQPVDHAILDRAEIALKNTSIDAVTFMRGQPVATTKPEQAYVYAGGFSWKPEDYKTGNTRALLELSHDSSAGVAIIRSSLADILARISPRDPQLCRLKDVGLYVHEVLLELTAEGHSFELIPDCFLTPAAISPSRETFELPRLTMRHLHRTHGMAAGTEAALLSRLSVETFASEIAHRNAEELLADLRSRMGDDILAPQNYSPAKRAFETYAKIAHAAGRPDLALELMAVSLTTDNPHLRSSSATPADLARNRAGTLDLVDLVAAGRHSSMNLDHPWSLRVNTEERMLEIHPNSSNAGDATLVFNNLSLPMRGVFVAELELSDTARSPVKFEIELQAEDSEMVREDWTLQPGERKSVELMLPENISSGCDVLLSTRMTNRRASTEGAHAKWYGPAFQPN